MNENCFGSLFYFIIFLLTDFIIYIRKCLYHWMDFQTSWRNTMRLFDLEMCTYFKFGIVFKECFISDIKVSLPYILYTISTPLVMVFQFCLSFPTLKFTTDRYYSHLLEKWFFCLKKLFFWFLSLEHPMGGSLLPFLRVGLFLFAITLRQAFPKTSTFCLFILIWVKL